MKSKRLSFILILLALILHFQVCPAIAEKSNSETGPVPKAVVIKPKFSFDPVLEGTIVTHEYQIGNKGQAMLHISKVRTSCGCTTAAYTKQINPGDTGKITIKGNTSGYGDRAFHKTIFVQTNDPKHPEIRLSISGKVEKFALIEPGRLVLRGHPGEKSHATVLITPMEKYPFRITKSFADGSLKEKIDFTLEQNADKYCLTVTNKFMERGNYRGIIFLKTDSKVKPEIPIRIYGIITDDKE